MTSIITLSIPEATTVHRLASGRTASRSVFYLVEQMMVSLVDSTQRIMAARGGGYGGVFEYDQAAEEVLKALQKSARSVTGIFVLVNSDLYQFSSSPDLTLELVGVIVGDHACIPDEGLCSNFKMAPLQSLRPEVKTVGVYLEPSGGEGGTKQNSSQSSVKTHHGLDGNAAWLRFFQTPTAEWLAPKSDPIWVADDSFGGFFRRDCGCGARHTSFPQLHTETCPKYTPIPNKDKD